MHYKILNKTILTSALVSLISLSAEQGLAQEVFDTESDDVLGTIADAPAIKAPVSPAEDDIIPVANNALIVPQPNQEPVQKAVKVVSEVKEEAVDIQKPAENPQKPVVLLEDVTASDNTDSKKETVILEEETLKAPTEADLLPKEDDFEINFDERKDVVPAEAKVNQPRKEPQRQMPNRPNMPRPTGIQNPAQNIPARTPQQEARKVSPELTFGEAILVQTNDDLFSQMSDIEKQTTLLTLELKKEKIKNEIEAAKAVRAKAEFDKQASEEAKKRAQIEWEKEQEAKVLRAEAELRQKEIELEKLQQRKALTAYMNSMLEQKQTWVNENAKLYDEIKSLKNKNNELRQTYQKSLGKISAQTSDLIQSAQTASQNHDRTIVSLTAQNTQLKKRIEASEKASQSTNGNPFAGVGSDGKIQTSADALIAPISVSSEYGIVEILGKEDKLTVKLMNKEGETFIAKKGTVLQTGHMVEEITPKFIRFSRNGLEDFLYTSSMAMEVEQGSISSNTQKNEGTSNGKSPVIPLIQKQETQKQEEDTYNIISESSLPSLGSTMFIK